MVKPIGVKLLNQYIKRELNTNPILKDLYVIGELTNLKKSTYNYCDLKEEDELINLVEFDHLLDDFEAGDKVVIRGYINTFTKASRYQIIVRQVEEAGQGQEHLNLLKLKKRLAEEGYFDQDKKLPLPSYPLNIGLITSDKGAAIFDFLHVMEDYNIGKISLFSTRVQGKNAINDIIRGLDFFNSSKYDLIVITRGGGSKEDLSVFNEEEIVKKIFSSKVAVLTAIGHEIDLSLVDLVADKSVSTPTKAAELIIKNYQDALANMDYLRDRNKIYMDNELNSHIYQLEGYRAQIEARSPLRRLDSSLDKIENVKKDMELAMNRKIYSYYQDIVSYNRIIEGKINERKDQNSFYIVDKDNIIDKNNLIIGSKYQMVSDQASYLIEVLEKIDDR